MYALPPCYHELLAVQEGHGLLTFLHEDKKKYYRNLIKVYNYRNTKSLQRIFTYQFCGVRSHLHLYPEELNVEIIYKNNKVITESEFSLQFHVIDHELVESIPTGVMISEINLYDPQELFVNDAP